VKVWILFLVAVSLRGLAADDPYASFPVLRGPYLGQEPPSATPRIFGEGFLKPPEGFHSSVVFNAGGDEAYWTAMGEGISYVSRVVDGVWSRPETLPFDPEHGVREPMFVHGDRRLFFLSRRPPPGDPVERERLWWVDRTDAGWSAPRVIDPVVARHPTHWQFSFTAGGDLYFTSEVAGTGGGQDVYVSRLREGAYQEPVSVGAGVNTDAREFCPFVAPDESYLLFARSVPEAGGRSDLFVSFRGADGEWSPAVGLGEAVNTPHNEVSPVVTPDGRYLFFLRVSGEVNDVWWVRAELIERLRG
jgi:hypothetical protein